MACVGCGSINSKPMKHLPLPEGRNGWVELSKLTDYCGECAEKEAIKMDEIFRKAKEGAKNGAI